MSLYSQLFLRDTNSPYGDVNRNSTLSFKDLDQNFLFLKERDINQLRVDGSDLIYETLGGTEYSVNIGGTSSNTFVTGFTFNSPSIYDLTIEQNGGEIPLTVDLSSLASDVYVLSGSYDPSTGDVEFTNSTGGTFIVSGFTTGMTDSYTDAATLNGNTIEFDNNIQGSNFYNVDLTPILSGKTDLTLFNSHTGDTNNPHQTSFSNLTATAHTHSISEVVNLQSELDGKTDNTDFVSHTGDTTIHFTKGDINLSDLGSSAHTHTLNEITDFNPYSGSVQTQLDSKTDISLFNTHTGDTNNPHQTSFSNLTSTAHTHTISDVINLQSELDSKTNNIDFISHTGDTTIHFTKSSINLSDLGNTAHTHTINEVINLQSELDSKTDLTLFNTHTGDTNNPHQTSFANLSSTAHTHTLSDITDFNSYSGSVQTQIDNKLNITDFNTYSGNVQTQLDTKIENGINSGGANEVFSGKSGTDLYFRTISGGSNTTVTTVGDIIKIDTTGGGGGGEINTASNIGGGEGLFSGKSGVDLQFKSLTSTGGTVTITSTGSTVNLESSGGGGAVTNDANNNLYGGTDTGASLSGSDKRNTLLGYRAGRNATTGPYNVVVGERSISDGVLTGQKNVAIGSSVMKVLTSGNFNVGIGVECGNGMTTQSNNTLIGFQAGRDLTGSNNVAITNSYGGSNMADRNVVVGQGDSSKTIGSYNVILGKAHSDVSNGNVMIGYNIQQNGDLTGDDNIFIHPNQSASNNYNTVSGDHNIAIGVNSNIPVGKSNFISIDDVITIDQDANVGGINVGGTGTLNAMWHIKGNGNTSATSSFLVEDSSSNSLVEIKDDGNMIIYGQSSSPIHTLTYSTNITTNFSNGNNMTLTLSGNSKLENPTNLKDGAPYTFIIKQDAIGGRILTFGTDFKFSGGTAPTLSTSADTVSILTFISDGTDLYCSGIVTDIS
jgi:hypothetical protein